MTDFVKYLFITICFSAYSQDYNPKTSNFPRPANVKQIIVTQKCEGCPTEKLDTSMVYHFNSKNLLVKAESYGDGQIQAIEDFHYDALGNIKQTQDHGRWQYSHDQENNEITEWDPSIMYIEKYTYSKNLLVKKEFFEVFSDFLVYSIEFVYNQNNEIRCETTKFYPNPNLSVFFEAGTSNIDEETNKTETIDTYTKERHDLEKDTYQIDYSVNDSLTGVEIFQLDSDGRIILQELYSTSQELRNKSTYTYTDNQLITIESTDIGIDGFGKYLDGMLPDMVKYEYNADGYMKSRQRFYGELFESTQYFQYELYR